MTASYCCWLCHWDYIMLCKPDRLLLWEIELSTIVLPKKSKVYCWWVSWAFFICGHSGMQSDISWCTASLLLWYKHLLTAQLHPDEVLQALVLQKHSWGRAGFEVKGNIWGQLCLQGGEVQVRGFLVERSRIPYRLWKKKRRTGSWIQKLKITEGFLYFTTDKKNHKQAQYINKPSSISLKVLFLHYFIQQEP